MPSVTTNTSIKPSAFYWLTCFWIFVEIVPGGLLHLTKIPITGLVVGSLAVLSQVLIYRCTQSSWDILKATAVVLSAKALITPYAGPTALFAVAVQGFTGAVILGLFKGSSFGIMVVSLTSMIVSSIMRWISLTLLFGVGIWKGLDQWVDGVGQSFGLTWLQGEYIVLIYVGAHVLWGLVLGIWIIRYLKQAGSSRYPTLDLDPNAYYYHIETLGFNKNHTYRWVKRFIMLVLCILLLLWLDVTFSWWRIIIVLSAMGVIYVVMLKNVSLSRQFVDGVKQMIWVYQQYFEHFKNSPWYRRLWGSVDATLYHFVIKELK